MRLLAQAAHMSPPQLQRTQLFAKWLLDIGDGLLNDEDNVTLPPGTFLSHCLPLNAYNFRDLSASI
jgi:hypothetical protein